MNTTKIVTLILLVALFSLGFLFKYYDDNQSKQLVSVGKTEMKAKIVYSMEVRIHYCSGVTNDTCFESIKPIRIYSIGGTNYVQDDPGISMFSTTAQIQLIKYSKKIIYQKF